MNSATAALHLALDAIGLARGDEVLVPTMTFAATAEVVDLFRRAARAGGLRTRHDEHRRRTMHGVVSRRAAGR